MHGIKNCNFRLGFKKSGDTNYSVTSAGEWVVLSFPLEESDCWEDKAVWYGIRKKHDTHIQYQPQSTCDVGLLHISSCSF